MTVEEMINKWAEKKYSLPNVTNVSFDIEGGNDYGCETCGYGSTPPHIEVSVVSDGRWHYFEESYAPDLINSILAEAVSDGTV